MKKGNSSNAALYLNLYGRPIHMAEFTEMVRDIFGLLNGVTSVIGNLRARHRDDFDEDTSETLDLIRLSIKYLLEQASEILEAEDGLEVPHE